MSSVSLRDKDNAKNLEELKIIDGLVINALKKSEENVTKEPILTKTHELTPLAQMAFADIFKKFSKDEKMTPVEFVNFYNAATSIFLTNAEFIKIQ